MRIALYLDEVCGGPITTGLADNEAFRRTRRVLDVRRRIFFLFQPRLLELFTLCFCRYIFRWCLAVAPSTTDFLGCAVTPRQPKGRPRSTEDFTEPEGASFHKGMNFATINQKGGDHE